MAALFLNVYLLSIPLLKAYKYRLLPSDIQKKQMESHFGSCRLVWNLALAVKISSWDSAKINVSRYDLQKQLVDLKSEYPWLYEVNAQSLQSVLLHLDKAYKRFFSGSGFPKFKKKSDRKSFQCPQKVKIIGLYIDIPIIRKIRFKGYRVFSGEIKNATISITHTGKYYASILVDNKKELPKKPSIISDKTIGLDVGVKSYIVTSNGNFFEPNRHLKNSLRRLQCLQKRASRKKIGGNNRKKSNLCVSILHEKIANQRADYIHKITMGLIRDNQAETFVIEDLNVAGMIKSRKLSQAIQDVSFGEFFRQLKYKCDWYGKNLITIGRFEPSSKTCSDCGAINEALTLKDREWTCANCNSMHERDFNAAKNIKAMGLKQYSPEGIRVEPVELRRVRRAKKQEKYLAQTLLSLPTQAK